MAIDPIINTTVWHIIPLLFRPGRDNIFTAGVFGAVLFPGGRRSAAARQRFGPSGHARLSAVYNCGTCAARIAARRILKTKGHARAGQWVATAAAAAAAAASNVPWPARHVCTRTRAGAERGCIRDSPRTSALRSNCRLRCARARHPPWTSFGIRNEKREMKGRAGHCVRHEIKIIFSSAHNTCRRDRSIMRPRDGNHNDDDGPATAWFSKDPTGFRY